MRLCPRALFEAVQVHALRLSGGSRETFKIPADAKPAAKRRRAAVPAATVEPHVAALAGAAEPGAYRREHGPP